jgi:hypothetical protein
MTDYFDVVRRELVAATARQNGAAEVRRRPLRRRRRLALVAFAATFLVVPASLAVTGIWPRTEPDGLVRKTAPLVVASGVDPVFGSWEAVVSESSAGRCVGLRLADPPGPEERSTYESCGGSGVAVIAGGDGPPRTGVFGTVPGDAAEVEARTATELARRVKAYAIDGDRSFYFAAFASNRVGSIEVQALDTAGRSMGIPLRSP